VPGLASGSAQGTLPWSWYVDPDLLRDEQERIFRRGWQYAGPAEHAAEPGDYSGRSVEAWGPLLFVHPGQDAPPLAGTLGPLPDVLASGGIDLDRLRFRRRSEFELACNWKIVVENYLECYHCAVAHPGFSEVVDVSPDAYRLETHALGSSQFGPTKRGEGPVEGQFHWLWPVTKVYALPGPPNLAAGPVTPLGPERTGGFLDYFFPEDVSDADVEELLAFDDQVGLEDRALVESVQAGVRSGLVSEGRLMPESERLLAHFQQLVREALA
jgi:phenylpropionate dioxygenase-like ring-hydroxylating dioxygenase large terminal subunit